MSSPPTKKPKIEEEEALDNMCDALTREDTDAVVGILTANQKLAGSHRCGEALEGMLCFRGNPASLEAIRFVGDLMVGPDVTDAQIQSTRYIKRACSGGGCLAPGVIEYLFEQCPHGAIGAYSSHPTAGMLPIHAYLNLNDRASRRPCQLHVVKALVESYAECLTDNIFVGREPSGSQILNLAFLNERCAAPVLEYLIDRYIAVGGQKASLAPVEGWYLNRREHEPMNVERVRLFLRLVPRLRRGEVSMTARDAFTREGWHHLLNGLRDNGDEYDIVSLSLCVPSSHSETDPTYASLVEVIENNTQLESLELHIWTTEFPLDGEALLRALRCKNCLKSLILYSRATMPFTVMDVMTKVPHLENLTVDSVVDAVDLFAAIRDNTTLKSLSFHGGRLRFSDNDETRANEILEETLRDHNLTLEKFVLCPSGLGSSRLHSPRVSHLLTLNKYGRAKIRAAGAQTGDLVPLLSKAISSEEDPATKQSVLFGLLAELPELWAHAE